jgi:hypothetical protein
VPLSHAVVFAAAQVNRAPEATMLRDLMPEAYQLRRKLLTSAVALAEAGLIPEREVRAIEEGRGQIDAAGDLTQLPPLYRHHQEAIAGKHPVSTGDLDRAEQLGKQLLEILRPGAATGPRNVNPKLVASVEATDRLWTLLVGRYELLWRTLAREMCFVLGALDALVPVGRDLHPLLLESLQCAQCHLDAGRLQRLQDQTDNRLRDSPLTKNLAVASRPPAAQSLAWGRSQTSYDRTCHSRPALEAEQTRRG